MSDTEIIELPDGRLRKQDKATGKVIWTQAKNKAQEKRLTKAKESKINNKDYIRLKDKDGCVVWAHKNMIVKMQDPQGNLINAVAGLDPMKIPRKVFHYSHALASLICSKVSEGKTIKELCKEEGMPGRTTIYEWQKQYTEFAEALNAAREIRAEYFADEMLETAEEVDDDGKFAIEKAKLKVKTLEWLAKKDNPGRYDRKSTSGGSSPANIYINTGVDDGKQTISIDGKKE